jgi:UDP:flavonoid glycosyltransferase YjiC (YdhE family)
MICNGGSPATQQALRAGIPVLALPSNLDQHLNTFRVERVEAGQSLRAERADAAAIRSAVRVLLDARRYREAAKRLAVAFAADVAPRRFVEILAGVI